MLWTLFFLGLKRFTFERKLQKGIDSVGLKDSLATQPKIVKVIDLDQHRSKLIITSHGVGIERYKKRKDDLEAAFKMIVQNIELSKDRQFVEMTLSKRKLPELVHYHEVTDFLVKPYSFVIGEGMDGPVSCSIRDLPHLLVAGMTGGGKSVFLKNVLIGLLESSPRIRLYLLDLKRGVEVKEFENLPNVKIAKNEHEAVKLLGEVKTEMESRFKLLESKGLKSIEPDEHKKDLIIVAVDEASVLYGKESAGSKKKKIVEEARSLTDEIAKLSRAAAIHLILATQKISKETIETKVQENMGGKMCFRVSTLQNSLIALGSPEAYKLPAIKGRGFWRHGLDLLEVQTPFMNQEEVDERIRDISEKAEEIYKKDNETTDQQKESENEAKRAIKSDVTTKNRKES